MNDLQSRLLSIATTFDQVCRSSNLRYYMLGGTMLGAVRHQGFIPWDDDMDFGMPRADYEKLIDLYKHNLFPDYIEMDFYITNYDSPFHYIKLIDNRTTLIEQNYHNHVEGVYIDVFPLDGASDHLGLARVNSFFVSLLHAFLINHYSTSKKSNMFKGIVKTIAEHLNPLLLHNLINGLMNVFNYEHSFYIANYLGAWGKKEIVARKVLGNPKEYVFEDKKFFGANDADLYLSSLYGNYMQLPAISDRIQKHNYYYLDLNMPYKSFLNKR